MKTRIKISKTGPGGKVMILLIIGEVIYICIYMYIREMYKTFEDMSENTNWKQQYQN